MGDLKPQRNVPILMLGRLAEPRAEGEWDMNAKNGLILVFCLGNNGLRAGETNI